MRNFIKALVLENLVSYDTMVSALDHYFVLSVKLGLKDPQSV